MKIKMDAFGNWIIDANGVRYKSEPQQIDPHGPQLLSVQNGSKWEELRSFPSFASVERHLNKS